MTHNASFGEGVADTVTAGWDEEKEKEEDLLNQKKRKEEIENALKEATQQE
jgi:hypothetical protein